MRVRNPGLSKAITPLPIAAIRSRAASRLPLRRFRPRPRRAPSTLFGERGELLGLVLGEQRLRQLGKIPVHDVVDLVEGETDAVVGDPSLRKIISADALGTVARADQGFARGGFLRLLLAPLLVLDARRKHRERLFFVLVLRARVLAFHHDSGGKMRDSNRRVGLVDVLAACARGAVGVDAKIRGIQYDVADCARLWQDGHRAGRSVDPALGLGRRHSLDAMAAGFELELGVGALTDNARDDLLIAAGITWRFGYNLHLPALAFGIARIHAKEVACEERRLVPSCSGADLEKDVAVIVGVLRQEQLLQLRFERGEPLPAGFDLAFRVASHFGIAEQLLRFGDMLLGVAILVEKIDHGPELCMLARKLAKLLQVARCALGGKKRADVLEPLARLIELGRDAGLHRADARANRPRAGDTAVL